MLSPALGILGKPLSMVYIDPEYREDLSVTLEFDGTEYECSPHPVIAGAYLREITADESGTFLLTWTVKEGDETVAVQAQSLYIYDSEEYIHPVTCYVLDAQGSPVEDTMVVITRWVSGHRELVAYDYVNDDGAAVFSLATGRYMATLVKSGATFSQNNSEMELTQEIDEYVYRFSGLYEEIPDVEYTPPVQLVTMSVSLIDAGGNPVVDRAVSVTCLQPAKHVEGSTFLALEGQKVLRTSPTGECSMRLVPGVTVEVAVENTSIIRRFVVPDEDFNLADFLGNTDFFSVANPVYQPAEKTS